MQKSAQNRSGKGIIGRVLGLSFFSAFIFTIVVAIRHMLETPMKLEGRAIAPPENATIEAYCAKCKTKRKMIHATQVTSKDGRQAVRGTCVVCGSNLHRFGRIKQQTST